MKTSLFFLSIASITILASCSDDTIATQLTGTEKQLTAHTWHGVWRATSSFTYLGEDVFFHSDKTLALTKCGTSMTSTWKVRDSIGASFLSIGASSFAIDKLTNDTLIIRDSLAGKYLLVREFNGYNRVGFFRIAENGAILGKFGCEPVDKTLIPEYNFSAMTYPNPCIGIASLDFEINQETSIDIKIDDGVNTLMTPYKGMLPPGAHSLALDCSRLQEGVNRISFTVTPKDSASKTVYSYILVAK